MPKKYEQEPDIEIFEIIAKKPLQEILDYLHKNPHIATAVSWAGDSTLHKALSRSDHAFAICECLLKHGANVRMRNHEEESVLHCAAAYGETECVELFLKHGLNIDLRDDEGSSAVHYAVSRDQLETLKRLEAVGANMHLNDKSGRNILHIAAICGGDQQTMEWIIAQGVSIDQTDFQGKKPLNFLPPKSPLRSWLKGLQKALHEKKELEGKILKPRSLGSLAAKEEAIRRRNGLASGHVKTGSSSSQKQRL